MKKSLIIVAMLMAMLPAVCLAGDVVVIANKSVSDTSLSQKSVSDIYLGKKSTWSDGSKINFVMLKGSAQDTFLEKYVRKSASQFNTFWKKQVFTGKGSPPKAFDSDSAMISFVAQTPGAIGYVSAGANVANVKTITIE